MCLMYRITKLDQEATEDDYTSEYEDVQDNTPDLRRGPPRASKQPINYKGMFIGNQDCGNNDYAFTLNIDCEDFISTPEYRTLSITTYISSEFMQETSHPCNYAAKIQAHKDNNPTYNEIL